MNILVVGGGGREHAISLSLHQSPLTKRLVVAPGNPGIADFAECIPIQPEDLQGQCKLAKKINADIVFIGPEIPLVLGLKDKLNEIGIQAFGPSAKAAQLEGSKIFSRKFCKRHNIPQPRFKYCTDIKTAIKEIELLNGYCVVKADGLAAGKGVIVCDNTKQAIKAAKNILEKKIFGSAGNVILIEERITGVEASLFAISDGSNAVLLGTAQDHKRAFDNDTGPNTGGMGAISPAPSLNKKLTNKIMEKIIYPTIQGMKAENMEYEGILYAGIMITKNGPKVIEFNCRFGDPESQAIIPLLKTDLVEIFKRTNEKKLLEFNVELIKQNAITVVIASKGYPGNFKKNQILPTLNNLKKTKDLTIYHSGTSINDKDELINSGGRVFSITAIGKNIEICRNIAYSGVDLINWKKGFYRTDIGIIVNSS